MYIQISNKVLPFKEDETVDLSEKFPNSKPDITTIKVSGLTKEREKTWS